MKRNISFTFILLIIALTLNLQACSVGATKAPDATPAPVHLKVMVLPYLSYAPLYIAQEEGFFNEQGLDVEFVRMDDTGESITALAQGQLDISTGTVEISVLNAIKKGTHIRYVADKGYFNPNSCDYATWVARKELVESGKLDDLKNVAGLKVQFGTAGVDEYFFDKLVEPAGLTSKDVNSVDLPPPTILESFSNNSLDISFNAEPWVTRSIEAGAVDWKSLNQYMANFPFSTVFFGPNMLDKNPDAGKRFMVAYLKGVRQYNQGKTDRNVEIIAKSTQMKPEEIKAVCWQTVKTDGSIDVQHILNFEDWAIGKAYLQTKIPADQLWDPQFIEYANKALQ
jgi:NitT/TauT family transport system substrate-binding protein